MILVDTSVWIDHLRGADARLESLLRDQLVMTHPFVIGELALGRLRARRAFLDDLYNLPKAVVAEESEVLSFIDRHDLAGCGIGYVDAHLLAATRLTVGASFWTSDKRLAEVAARLDLAIAGLVQ